MLLSSVGVGSQAEMFTPLVCLKCTYFISFSSSQISPRIVCQKSPRRCVSSPPSSPSTSTITVSSASQKPLSICRCWPIWTSGALWITSYRVCFLRSLLQLVPRHRRCRQLQRHTTEQKRQSFMLIRHPKRRSTCCLSLQPKSPVSFAKIPVQPPPQSSPGEQQQAGVHPRRDRQSQRVNGIGEQHVCYVWVCSQHIGSLPRSWHVIVAPCRTWAAMRSRCCLLRWGGSKP